MATFTGTSGDDSLQGTQAADFFNVYQGGNDTVSGLAGNDIFNFGAAFTAADTVDGGTGSDTVELKGDYTTAVTLGATTLTSVEQIKAAAGFNYDFVFNDVNVAAGATLTINAANLGGADSFTLDGSHETDGYFRLEGGAGNDVVSMGAAFRAQDRFDGGSGNDVVYVAGDFSFGFTNATLRNIDTLVLAGGHDYHFVTNDANVTAGATLDVDASELGAGDKLVFSGTHETDGSFIIDAGAGLDELTGGAQNDSFAFGAHLTAADRVNGGAGSDTVSIGGANYDLVLQHATLTSIENVTLGAGFNYNLKLGGAIAADATMTIDASALGAGSTLAVDAHKETEGGVIVNAGVATATLTGGQVDDQFAFAGDFNAGDTVDGQGGFDSLAFDGAYTGANAIVLTGSQVQNVEEFDFAPGHSYNVTIAAATVGADGLTVDASQLGASDSLTFNAASASGSQFLTVTGGAGDDVLSDGADNDVFDLSHGGNDTATGGSGSTAFVMGAALNAGDRIDGGTGINDHLSLNGDYTGANALVCSATTFVNIDAINMAAGHSYTITIDNANVGNGQTLTVNARSLTATDHAIFDGSAETGGGHFKFISGEGSDTFAGGNAFDTFVYDTGLTLSGATRDIIKGFDSSNDTVQFAAIDTENAAVNQGTVNAASIDTDIAHILTSAKLSANSFVLLTPQSGNLQGHVFLVVDGNGTAGYQAGSDLVIELQNPLNINEMSPDNFTV